MREVNPEIVFLPWPHDNHYDHARTARASLEALSYVDRFADGPETPLRLREILAYAVSSWQTREFEPDFFINISDEVEAVVASIKAFRILGQTAELYADDSRIRARHWGIMAGTTWYAEGLKHLGPAFPVRSLLAEIFGEDLRPVGSIQYPWGARFF